MSAGSDAGTWLSEEQLRSRRPWYLVGVALLIASAVFHQPLLFIAGLLALALAAIPELWYRFCFAGLVYKRQLSERRVFFGETITVRQSVENRKPLPLPWLEVEDEFPEALTIQGGRLERTLKPRRVLLVSTLSLWWYQRVSRRYHVQCAARGIFTLGPLQLRSGDPFGLLTREQHLEQQDTFLVYPLVLPIERFGLPAHHPFGEPRAPRRLLEDPSRVIGVRDWQPEDDLRRVHWSATARAMRLQSKVYEPTTTYTLALFVNVNTFANPVLGINPPLLELTISAAASVASWATEQGYAVGLYSNGLQALKEADEEDTPALSAERAVDARQAMRVRLPPASRPEQLPRILESLARLIPYFGSPMEDMLATEQRSLPVGSTIVLVSAAAAVIPEQVSMLLQMQAHGHAVALLLSGNAPIDAPGLPVYRLGAEEVWHEIVAQATRPESAQAAEAGQRFLLA
jgi:uncharacterized protein (DUF58 family)